VTCRSAQTISPPFPIILAHFHYQTCSEYFSAPISRGHSVKSCVYTKLYFLVPRPLGWVYSYSFAWQMPSSANNMVANLRWHFSTVKLTTFIRKITINHRKFTVFFTDTNPQTRCETTESHEKRLQLTALRWTTGHAVCRNIRKQRRITREGAVRRLCLTACANKASPRVE
jgi:hypothetical protein